jgi:hypothetical protein
MHTDIVRLRALVGYLGESDQFGWWNTSFLGRTGQRFLQRPFPRSSFAAGLHSVTVAARDMHDRSVGKGNVTHLFRLGYANERKIAEELRDYNADTVRNAVSDRDAAMNALDEMARAVDPAQGAVRIGRISDLLTQDGVGRIAGHYHAAFSSGGMTFPYFSDA